MSSIPHEVSLSTCTQSMRHAQSFVSSVAANEMLTHTPHTPHPHVYRAYL